jgi:uncharacterized glyoxalase superfamily protein PhnB
MNAPTFLGLTPYLYYENADEMVDWLIRHFGFEEIRRFRDVNGKTTNAELRVGTCELWIDGYPGYWTSANRKPDQWIGVWVADVDALWRRLIGLGITCEEPRNREHGVREIGVTDPQGYMWGFLQRI